MKRIITIIVAIIITGFIMFMYFIRNDSGVESKPKSQSDPAVPIVAERAAIKSLHQTITNTATLSAYQKGEIASEISSTVFQLNVRNGEPVEAGDTLIILDQHLAQFELEKSRGDFIKATNEFISELKLSDSKNASVWEEYLNLISRADIIPPLPNSLSKSKMMSIVRFNLHTHYNQVKKNERQIQNCIIKAPFDGIVSDIKVYNGASVNVGTVLLTLTDISKMNVEIDVLESDLSFIHIGTPFEFINQSQNQYEVSAIHPRINPDTRSGKALAVIPNADYQFKDAQKVMVRLEKQTFTDRLVIPRKAILTRNDRDLIFVVKSGIAKWQYIKTGVGNNDVVEILEGVAIGDTVVTGGHYSLAHDVPVTVKLVNGER